MSENYTPKLLRCARTEESFSKFVFVGGGGGGGGGGGNWLMTLEGGGRADSPHSKSLL